MRIRITKITPQCRDLKKNQKHLDLNRHKWNIIEKEKTAQKIKSIRHFFLNPGGWLAYRLKK